MSIQANFPALKPTLLLDFANVKQLDPRITFTRASEGRYYDGKTFAKAEENLLLQSQALATSPWNQLRATRTNNADTAPDGTTTATRLTQQSGQTTFGSAFQNASVSANATTSVFAKADGKNFLVVQTQSASSLRTWFNLSTGAVGTTNANHTASIVSVGNGWYRCIVTSSQTGDSTTLYLADTDGSQTVTDSGSILLWGAQLEQRSSVTAYTATTTQPITNYIPVLMTAANGVARFDHNPTTEESLGLLIEEQRTNLVTYSEQFDNASWGKNGVTVSADTAVAPNGIQAADSVIATTTNAAHFLLSGSIAFTSGTAYTQSVYAKALGTAGYRFRLRFNAAAFTSILSADFDLTAGTVTGVTAGGAITATITPVGNGWYRCTATATATATVSSDIYWMLLSASGVQTHTGDGFSGAFLWGAQLEAGAFATSYIPTVAAQVTRSADAASMTGTNFSSWYRPDEGTFFAAYQGSEGNIARRTLSVNDGTSSNAITLNASNSTGGTANYIDIQVGGVTQALLGSGAYSATAQVSAFAYKFNDTAFSKNAAAALSDTSCVIPAVTQFEIGQQAASLRLNGTIRKIAFYPARVTNAQLQALTS